MPKSVQEILIEARELIINPEHHCQGHLAVDREGEIIQTNHTKAYAFCAFGALWRTIEPVSDDPDFDDYPEEVDELTVAQDLLDDVALDLYGRDAVKVNDELGHEAIIKVYDRAILEVSDGT